MAKSGSSINIGSAYASGVPVITASTGQTKKEKEKEKKTSTVFAPSIKTEAAKQGLTPSEYLAQLEQQRGAGVQRGPDPVAVVYDPWSYGSSWYYIRAESIDGQQETKNFLSGGSAYAPGSPVVNALKDMDVEHVPVLRPGPQANGTWLDHQEVREQQQVIPGTMMEHNFPGGPRLTVGPSPQAPPAPAPEQPAPRYAMPGTTAPKLGVSPNKGGQRATGLVTGSRNVLDVFISPDSPGALVAGITLKPRR